MLMPTQLFMIKKYHEFDMFAIANSSMQSHADPSNHIIDCFIHAVILLWIAYAYVCYDHIHSFMQSVQ